MEAESKTQDTVTEVPPAQIEEENQNKEKTGLASIALNNGTEINTSASITPTAIKCSPKRNSRKPKKRKQKIRDVTAPRQPLTGRDSLFLFNL